MKLLRLALTDFRNYQRAVWEPHSLINVLHGPNGSGKTSLLEALSLLAPGRGLHNTPVQQLCRFGTQQWGVVASLESQKQHFSLATGIQPSSHTRRLFLVDGEPVKSQGILSELYSCVWITPAMDRLFNDHAAQRRRFFDRLVAALIPDHTQQLIAHARSITSRNKVLATRPDENVWLNSLESSISRHAVAITAARLATAERLHTSSLIVEGFPKVEPIIRCQVADKLKSLPALHVEDWLKEALRQARDEDCRRAMTSIGAHRTDWTLFNTTQQHDASFCSSGQQKIMLLSLILSHAQCVQEIRAEAPLVLLDEPFVHLDSHHRTALMNALRTLRTTCIVTGTDAELFAPMKQWAEFVKIEEGNLYPTYS